MENAWEPMKNRNSLAVSERLWNVVGTISHMLGKKRKGPQLMDGWILGSKTRLLQQHNTTYKTLSPGCFFNRKGLLSAVLQSWPSDLRINLNISFYCWHNKCALKLSGFFCNWVLEGERCSRSDTVNHYSRSQTPTKQEDHQEEESGGGGAKGSQRRPAIIEERDLRVN